MNVTSMIYIGNKGMWVHDSIVPRPLPCFVSQLWSKLDFSPQLRDKILGVAWEQHESLFFPLRTTSAPPLPSSLSLSSCSPPPLSFPSITLLYPRTFKLPCHGTGILPSLELSENAINFAPTIVNNVRTARVSLHNPKLGRLNSAVIRGAILQQGPKAFEFIVPRGFPISVCPQVGVVPLGKVRRQQYSGLKCVYHISQ